MLKNSLIISLLILVCSLAHAGDVDPLALAACQKASAAFSKQIAGDLHDVILEKGIIGAIEICAERVNNTGQALSLEPGLRVERVTLLTLKDQKRSDSFEGRMLRAMQDSVAAGREIEAEAYEWTGTDIHSGTLVYVKPIMIEPLCLACHGPAEMVQSDVREIMQNKYHALPSGNKIGDVKGAVVVTLELPAGKKLLEASGESDTQQ